LLVKWEVSVQREKSPVKDTPSRGNENATLSIPR
jgi:hypothetical protein